MSIVYVNLKTVRHPFPSIFYYYNTLMMFSEPGAERFGKWLPQLCIPDHIPDYLLHSLHNNWPQCHLWYHCWYILRTQGSQGGLHNHLLASLWSRHKEFRVMFKIAFSNVCDQVWIDLQGHPQITCTFLPNCELTNYLTDPCPNISPHQPSQGFQSTGLHQKGRTLIRVLSAPNAYTKTCCCLFLHIYICIEMRLSAYTGWMYTLSLM